MSVVVPQNAPAAMPAAPPAAAAINPAMLAALLAGAAVRALVQAAADPALMRLQLPGGAAIDVASPTKVPAGTPVEVTAQGTPDRPQILVRTLATPTSGQAPDVTINSTGAPSVRAPLQSAPPSPAQTAEMTIIRQAAAQQSGLSQLYANLDAALARPQQPLPAPVRAAIDVLMALRLVPDGARAVDAPAVKAALASAGLAKVSAAAPGSALPSAVLTPAGAMPAAPMIQPALTALRNALVSWIGSEATQPDLTAKDIGPVRMALPGGGAPPTAPPPPHRLAATIPQPALLPTLDLELTPRETAWHLLRDTESALARHTLLQFASRADDGTPAPRHDPALQRVTLDMPIVLPEGTAVAQVKIEQEQGRNEQGQPSPVWRASFSIDLEPIGPVHVRIALVGERTAVTLHAERDDSAALLSEHLTLLEASLRDAALQPGELRCRGGAREPSAAPPGLFVDQAS